ncbi:hypothetical protein OSB04_030174 [Centaurea solstitialis]|uniref:FAD-binding PCMH-type domain-containing protein n=1 Tax=Centaurea solstitialis TaxID=347529 RepID=A0AA38W6W0_9ASTR|nr:hypothetical protein OSB04_030174 [Centaurea solstitialis]
MAIIISSSFNMQFSIFALLFLLLSFQSYATSSTSTTSTTDRFIQCLHDRSDPSFPITGEVYTPVNSSFPSVLQAYIRNLRFNETTTPKPVLIVTALHPSHVQAAVVCAKEHRLLMRTRSGGHDYEGLSYVSNSNQPFFVVDMFNLRSVNVSIERETAWVQAGATLGEVYYRIAEKSNTHGFPAGVCPTVGVGGHFSGGGYGNLMRKYGLSVDNIIDAELIDANGRLLNRKSMGEDLFWAITGGGGISFGVVLSYTIKLVRVPAVVTVFNVERTYEQNLTTIAERWVEVADKFDKDLFVRMTFSVVNDTNGEKTIRAIFPSLYLGNSTTLVALMNKDFPELGLRISDCTEMSWIESVLFYTVSPLIKSDYVQNPISKQGFEFIFEKMKELENQMLAFNPYGGRMSEIPNSLSPFRIGRETCEDFPKRSKIGKNSVLKPRSDT